MYGRYVLRSMCVSDFDHEQERDKTGNEALRGRSLQTTFHRLSAAPVEGLIPLGFPGKKRGREGVMLLHSNHSKP